VRRLRQRRALGEGDRRAPGDPARAEVLTDAHGEALAHLRAGAKRLEAGRYADAERQLRLALRFAPGHPDALNLLGIALLRGDRVVEAIEQFRGAVAVAPQAAGHQMNLGYALLRNGEIGEAVSCLDQALRLAPGSAEIAFYLGLALRANRDFAGAELAMRRAIDAAPAFEEARHELHKLVCEAGRIDEARALFGGSLAPGKRLRLALTSVPPIPGSTAQIAEVRAKLEAEIDALAAEAPRIADPRGEVDATTFYLSYHGLPNRALNEKLARLYLAAHPELAWTAPHCAAPRRTSDRLRVGILSRYLYEHSIGRTTRGLVAMLDRKRFELTAIFIPPVPNDEYSRAIAAGAERTLILPSTLAGARNAIAQLELDVLFYQDIGMDPFTYFLAFARLAPVQCVSFGHPDTSGIPNLDWYLSLERFEPHGAEAQYSERLWRIPEVGNLAYYYHPARAFKPPSREELGLPTDKRLYTCPQALQKLHPDFDVQLAEILRRDGDGRLALIALGHKAWSPILMERLRKRMPDEIDRVLLLPPMKHDRFLGVLAASDVVLDTPHFNGYNSSLEAFAVGTPIVTRPGPLQRRRHTAGMYAAMDIDGLCASSDEEYVRLALEIARDSERRMAYSRSIREREAALFEDSRVVRGYEAFFEAVSGRAK
jgi:predicted O-linked N-acetylglucosamine transferase (SPINDLY family)